MRLSQAELEQLKNSITTIDHQAKVYLFGSRLDNTKRGGDIDILILTKQKLKFEELSKIRWSFYEKFGEQKLDLVNFTFNDDTPFKKLILTTAQEI